MLFTTYCHNPYFWQTYLSYPANITMEGILFFDKHLLFLLVFLSIIAVMPKGELWMEKDDKKKICAKGELRQKAKSARKPRDPAEIHLHLYYYAYENAFFAPVLPDPGPNAGYLLDPSIGRAQYFSPDGSTAYLKIPHPPFGMTQKQIKKYLQKYSLVKKPGQE